MKTYRQAREVIRDICSTHAINSIKAANKELKKFFGSALYSIQKTEDALSTTVCMNLQYPTKKSLLSSGTTSGTTVLRNRRKENNMTIHIDHPDGNRYAPYACVPTVFEIVDDSGNIVNSFRFSCAAGDEYRWWSELYDEYCDKH